MSEATLTGSDRKRALVIYSSTHGHTAKIASNLAGTLQSNGLRVDVRELLEGSYVAPGDYDAIVAAASIHRGHHQKEMVEWVKEHRRELDAKSNAFISVSLTAAEDTDEAREATAKCIEDFRMETGWRPDRTEPVAGALQYREYDAFTRIFVRLLMKQGGHPTDTSRDHDFTDWKALHRLGDELAAQFSAVTSA